MCTCCLYVPFSLIHSRKLPSLCVSVSPSLSLPFVLFSMTLSCFLCFFFLFVFFFSSPSGCSLCTPCRYNLGLWVFSLYLSSSAWEIWDWVLDAFLDEETHGHRALRESPLHPGQQQSLEQSSLLLQATHPALEERRGNPSAADSHRTKVGQETLES